MYRVILTVLATLLLFASLTAIDVQAADAGEDNATGEVQKRSDDPSNKIKQPGFVDIVFLSGPISVLIWLLIFSSSFAMIALIVDGILQTKRDKILPVHVVEGVRAALDDGDLGNAVAGNLVDLAALPVMGFEIVSIDHPLDVRGDKLYLSDRPGLGIEMDKDYMRAHVVEGYGG